ncbi:MAG: hypothetical protein ACLP7Q_13270 [Isosphaeraceae bacterium]
MKLDEIKRAKDQRPFQPFLIRMADGREIRMSHPDAISWDEESPRMAFAISKGEHCWIEVALIRSLVLTVPASGEPEDGERGNGDSEKP